MASNKHISKIIIAVMAVSVALCLLAVANADTLMEKFGGTGVAMEYETKLFNTDEPISIDIRIDEDQWNKMLQNASSEEYYTCDVVINGKTVKNVAIRPKGNTSLSAIAMDPDTDRFSFKLEFDHYVDGQTCYGLDKLILNNNYADATNMKEAIIYDMYRYLGADASLCNYAKISVNGEYWGVYLALESVEQSFMLRNFGTQDGELYKPDSMEMGGGGGGSFMIGGGKRRVRVSRDDSDSSNNDSTDAAGDSGGNSQNSDGSNSDSNSGGFPGGGGERPSGGEGFPGGGRERPSGDDRRPSGGEGFPGGGGGFSMGGGGANLNYTDNELDSYSTIWNGGITGSGDKDHRRVVTALKNVSEGTELEKYLDIDNVLKYMAVHTFAVNMDSLSGSMAHNYYLYEYDGQLNIIPWDYNLSFGGMSMGSSGDATEMVNDAIDTPFSGTKFFDALLENEEYRERYHAYLQQLVDEYVNGGRFDEVYQRIRSQIDPLVETDPTAFYSYEEYQTAASLLYETIKLRAESIEGQLNGTIPSTDDGQRQNPDALIDASHIDIKAMGQFNMGGFGGGGSKGDSEENSGGAGSVSGDAESSGGGNIPDMGNFDPSSMPDMGNFDPSSMPNMGNFEPNSIPDKDNFDPSNMPDTGSFDPSNMPDTGDFNPDNMSGMPGQPLGQNKAKKLLSYGIYLGIMVTALLIVSRIKRRK